MSYSYNPDNGKLVGRYINPQPEERWFNDTEMMIISAGAFRIVRLDGNIAWADKYGRFIGFDKDAFW